MVAGRTAELREANERLMLALEKGKRIEQMMWKGAERYKNMYENSPLGMYRANPDGRILMANPALVRMLGYPSFVELASTTETAWGDYEPKPPAAGVQKASCRRGQSERLRRGVEAA